MKKRNEPEEPQLNLPGLIFKAVILRKIPSLACCSSEMEFGKKAKKRHNFGWYEETSKSRPPLTSGLVPRNVVPKNMLGIFRETGKKQGR